MRQLLTALALATLVSAAAGAQSAADPPAPKVTVDDADPDESINPPEPDYTIISLPHISQIYMMFRAQLLDRDFGAGPESLEVRLFGEDEIPWEELAFRTIGRTLRNYFLDRKLGTLQTRVSALERRAPRPDLSGAG